jgi:hypothetical protein
MIAAAIMLGTPAAALAVSAGVAPEETEERTGSDTMWNLVGLIGLFGLIGFSRPSDNDGYTDDPI